MAETHECQRKQAGLLSVSSGGRGAALTRHAKEAREVPGLSKGRSAFTLVELLVVIGVLSVLLAILMPVVSAARVRAERTVCAARLHSLAQTVHLYAIQHKGRLPAGTGPLDEHCIFVPYPTYDALVSNMPGSAAGI